MRQTAQAEGKEEPDAAFEQRLKSLRESAKARAQVIPACFQYQLLPDAPPEMHIPPVGHTIPQKCDVGYGQYARETA